MRTLTDVTVPRLRVGCCGSMIAPAADPVGIEIAEELAAFGFDYIELSLRDLAVLPETAITQLISRLQRTGLACEVCNNFFPSEIRLTGAATNLSAALLYARAALARAACFGVSVVVFGSSGARNIPMGFPREAAWVQLRDLLRQLGPIAEDHGITLALEHLNRQESNILNSVAECWRLAQEVAHPRVRLLIDSYHLLVANENLAILSEVAPAIAHVHMSQGSARDFPTARDEPLAAFFQQLGAIGYKDRCSIESYTTAFATDAPRALAAIREYSQPRVTH